MTSIVPDHTSSAWSSRHLGERRPEPMTSDHGRSRALDIGRRET